MSCTPIRVTAFAAVTALLCGCVGGNARSVASPSPAAGAPAPAGPPNAPVAAAGALRGVPLDADQLLDLRRAVAAVPENVRPRLRYALAAGDDGLRHLVVYDGEGLPADGRHPGKKFEYVVFRVLNATHGEHYDPQQNAMIAAIPPPKQRTSAADEISATK